MKKILLFLLLITPLSFSQRESLIDGEIENGGFAAVTAKFSNIKNKEALLVGGYCGWLINHKLLIGLGGYGLANNIPADKTAVSEYNFVREALITFGYGGMVLEYYIQPNSVVHSSVSCLIGGGGVFYRQGGAGEYFDSHWGESYRSGTSAVFVCEPGLSAEVNVTTYMKVGIGATYRYVSGVELTGLKNSDLSNFSGFISFKFGKF